MKQRITDRQPELLSPERSEPLPAVKPSKLMRFVRQHFDALISPDANPLPQCYWCGSEEVRVHGMHERRVGTLPSFLCKTCGRTLNRLTGTPFASTQYGHQVNDFIELLSKPLSCTQAARDLSSRGCSVAHQVRNFRTWLLELDPSGRYEQYVRLGGQITAVREDACLVFEENGVREDLVLTAALSADFDDVFSLDIRHPLCPACNGRSVRRKGCQGGFPLFFCNQCRKKFNRRTNTAYQRYKSVEKHREFIRYLGLPLSLTQTAEIFATDPRSVSRWIGMFRTRCEELDPMDKLAPRIRLGVRPTTRTPCAHCGLGRLVISAAGRAVCSSCRQIFSMRRDLFENNGVLEVGLPQWDEMLGVPVVSIVSSIPRQNKYREGETCA